MTRFKHLFFSGRRGSEHPLTSPRTRRERRYPRTLAVSVNGVIDASDFFVGNFAIHGPHARRKWRVAPLFIYLGFFRLT